MLSQTQFENPHFTINFNFADYKDRVYLENFIKNTKEDRESTEFIFEETAKI